GEEAFGFVVLHVKITAHAAEAIGLTQLLPAIGGVNRAAKLCRIDERFDQHYGMAIAGLPVGAQTIQRQAQRTGTQVGKGFVRQRRARAFSREVESSGSWTVARVTEAVEEAALDGLVMAGT